MPQSEITNLAVAENLIEVCHLLKNTKELIRLSDKEAAEPSLVEFLDNTIAAIESGPLTPIVSSHPSIQFALDHFSDENAKERRTSDKTKPSPHLSFNDNNSAVLIRQALFNTIYFVERGLSLYIDSPDVPDSERMLYRHRAGRILGGPLKDILFDLFIAHPDLATGGFEDFDWSKAKTNRDDPV